MTEDIKFAVLDGRETLAESFYKDIVTFSFLCFSIWLSQGSKWWTLVTGLMFMMFVFGKIAVMLKHKQKRFKNKDELISWAKSLEDV
jgi:hypothetical protein